MKVKITIEDVPEEVRDGLMRRAVLRGQSLQEFLLGKLERLAKRPSGHNKALMEKARARLKVTGTNVSAEAILRARDAGREEQEASKLQYLLRQRPARDMRENGLG